MNSILWYDWGSVTKNTIIKFKYVIKNAVTKSKIYNNDEEALKRDILNHINYGFEVYDAHTRLMGGAVGKLENKDLVLDISMVVDDTWFMNRFFVDRYYLQFERLIIASKLQHSSPKSRHHFNQGKNNCSFVCTYRDPVTNVNKNLNTVFFIGDGAVQSVSDTWLVLNFSDMFLNGVPFNKEQLFYFNNNDVVIVNGD